MLHILNTSLPGLPSSAPKSKKSRGDSLSFAEQKIFLQHTKDVIQRRKKEITSL